MENKPEPECPKSTLSYNDLCNINSEAYTIKQQGTGEGQVTIGLRLCADAAIEEFIKSGEAKKYFDSIKET